MFTINIKFDVMAKSTEKYLRFGKVLVPLAYDNVTNSKQVRHQSEGNLFIQRFDFIKLNRNISARFVVRRLFGRILFVYKKSLMS